MTGAVGGVGADDVAIERVGGYRAAEDVVGCGVSAAQGEFGVVPQLGIVGLRHRDNHHVTAPGERAGAGGFEDAVHAPVGQADGARGYGGRAVVGEARAPVVGVLVTRAELQGGVGGEAERGQVGDDYLAAADAEFAGVLVARGQREGAVADAIDVADAGAQGLAEHYGAQAGVGGERGEEVHVARGDAVAGNETIEPQGNAGAAAKVGEL